ncbi:MAG: 3-hydroxyacyl-CoA dehydrogenase family protein [Smithella sp.]
MEIKTISVVGAGNMGRQIALQCALSGFKVFCTDSMAPVLKSARDFSDKWLSDRVAKNKLQVDEAQEIQKRLFFTEDLTVAAGDADLIIEAIIEILEAKRALFKELDKICPPHTILATNSSYIVSSKIADATKRPDKVLNMHFFNPALVMKLVEVVQGPHVSDETVNTVMEVSRALSKSPTKVNKEIYGFICNRMFSAITREACSLFDLGIASLEDIDNAARNGLGHPMGPFQLLDMTGIDLEYFVTMEKFQETQNPADRPSPSIVERYARGNYGRKTGDGFYHYEKK